jgi:ribosomal protein S18 acetylase RimI-like enzyme
MAGETVAYSCYGLIPCTLHSYDLYWIATHKDFMNKGIGRALLRETENAIWKSGGTGIYVETSSKDQYSPTRAFYDNNGYILKARYEDFYDRGDDKCVYIKRV